MIREYKGINDPALIRRLFTSGGMLFGMQLSEILWVCNDSIEVGLYGCITTPFNNRPVYATELPAHTHTIASVSSGSSIVGSAVAEVRETEYPIMDFFVQGAKGIFKGIKVKSLAEAGEIPAFYALTEDMIDSLVMESFRTIKSAQQKPPVFKDGKLVNGMLRPKERTGRAVNFKPKREEKKDRMILI